MAVLHKFCARVLLVGLSGLLVACQIQPVQPAPAWTEPPPLPVAQLSPVVPGMRTSTLPALPIRLQIPAIGVDAAIEAVGEDDLGAMAVPQDAEDVAWYEPGVLPGAVGNAVFSGHLDDYVGAAVFWDLHKLRVGDHLIVTDRTGVDRTFTVMGSETYPADDAPIAQIFGFDLHRDLNLITCNGSWDLDERDYNRRLVVYARQIDY